jgi:hypothetical protein
VESINNEIMNFELLIETINKDIQDIEKSIKNFKNRSSLPRVEIDLTLEKVRKLYDSLQSLIEKRPVEKTTPPEDKPENINTFELEENSSDTDKNISEASPVITKEPGKNPEEELQIKFGEQKNGKTEIIADRLQNGQSFRNESLRQQVSSKDLSSKLKSQPISDIGAAMGLNEKFSFIRELFNNDPDKFTETINILNNASNFNEAYSYLSDKFNWNMDDSQVQKLLDLTRRKLIIRENE